MQKLNPRIPVMCILMARDFRLPSFSLTIWWYLLLCVQKAPACHFTMSYIPTMDIFRCLKRKYFPFKCVGGLWWRWTASIVNTVCFYKTVCKIEHEKSNKTSSRNCKMILYKHVAIFTSVSVLTQDIIYIVQHVLDIFRNSILLET